MSNLLEATLHLISSSLQESKFYLESSEIESRIYKERREKLYKERRRIIDSTVSSSGNLYVKTDLLKYPSYTIINKSSKFIKL